MFSSNFKQKLPLSSHTLESPSTLCNLLPFQLLIKYVYVHGACVPLSNNLPHTAQVYVLVSCPAAPPTRAVSPHCGVIQMVFVLVSDSVEARNLYMLCCLSSIVHDLDDNTPSVFHGQPDFLLLVFFGATLIALNTEGCVYSIAVAHSLHCMVAYSALACMLLWGYIFLSPVQLILDYRFPPLLSSNYTADTAGTICLLLLSALS